MMKTRVKILVRFVLFCMVAFFCVQAVNETLTPDSYYTEEWSSANTFKDFYELDKNTVDVLFMGSSHAVTALNPQVIYDRYGITSYNLSSMMQSMVVTYYWLKEALKYQSPKVVVLETYMLHKYPHAEVNDLNSAEGALRQAMDNMKLSPLKWEAANAIEKIDPTQSGLSYVLLNIRYHSRWTFLTESDFTEKEMINHGAIKGFSVCDGGIGDYNNLYVPFKDAEAMTTEAEDMFGASGEYLDKIVELCEKKGIRLVLTKIPSLEPMERYKSTKEYAEEHDIPFYDFNEERLYNEIGYNSAEDQLHHLNHTGAEKISDYFGNLLVTEYGVSLRVDSSYDKSRAFFNHCVYNIGLTDIGDPYQYLDKINSDYYSVFVFGPSSYSACLDDEMMDKLYALGFSTDLRYCEDNTRYFAMKEAGGTVVERLSREDFVISGSFRNGVETYTCKVSENDQDFSMVIAGSECGNSNPGLNIVVYDNDMKRILDKVNINTTVPELTLSRY